MFLVWSRGLISKVKYDENILKEADDEKLQSLIYNKACELHFSTFGQSFKAKNDTLKIFLAMWELCGDVYNGGFDQYFYNYSLLRVDLAKNAFKLIGAIEIVEIIEQAIKVFENQSIEFKNKRNHDLDKFDDEFYDYENLEKLQIRYIRNHINEFLVE